MPRRHHRPRSRPRQRTPGPDRRTAVYALSAPGARARCGADWLADLPIEASLPIRHRTGHDLRADHDASGLRLRRLLRPWIRSSSRFTSRHRSTWRLATRRTRVGRTTRPSSWRPTDERVRTQREAIDALPDAPPRGPEGPAPVGAGRNDGGGARSSPLLVKSMQGETPSLRASRQRNAEANLSDGLRGPRRASLRGRRQAPLSQRAAFSGREDFGNTPNEARDRRDRPRRQSPRPKRPNATTRRSSFSTKPRQAAPATW